MSIIDRIKRRLIERKLRDKGYLVISAPLTYEDWQRVTELWRKCKPEICVTDEQHAEQVVQKFLRRKRDK